MANWAYTNYVIEGDKETLNKIYNAIQHPALEEGESEGWEGGVLRALNIDWLPNQPDGSGYYMRGFICTDSVDLEDDVLTFDAEEAWGVTDFHEVLEKNIPGIKVFYSVEEEGEEVYATNDKEGKYFPDRYYVDTCIDGDYQSEYFNTEEAVYKWLGEITNGRIASENAVEIFNSNYEDSEASDENYINIHKFEIVD